jgi:predicted DCC family thiol-disulfide oxidoreductase YuxK
MCTFSASANNRSFARTDAALEIALDFSGFWYALRALKIIPRPLRDYFYDYIATNRYKVFGKRDSCMMPTSEIRSRFL